LQNSAKKIWNSHS